MLFQKMKTKLQLSFYIAVLPLLNSYVCLFQGKDTLIHLVHEKQVQQFTDFLGCFIKPEHVVGKSGKELKALDLESDEDGKYMKQRDMFVGGAAKKIIKIAEKEDSDVNKFRNQASAAYTCSTCKSTPTKNATEQYFTEVYYLYRPYSQRSF